MDTGLIFIMVLTAIVGCSAALGAVFTKNGEQHNRFIIGYMVIVVIAALELMVGVSSTI